MGLRAVTGRYAFTLATTLLAGGAWAQSPLVVDPQQGATPRPLPTAAPALPVADTPSTVVVPAEPRLAPVELPRRVGPISAPVSTTATRALPEPGGNPMAIDPAKDPILNRMRATSSRATFRAAVTAAIEQNAAFDEAFAVREEAVAARNEARARRFPVLDLSLSSFKVIDRAFSNDPGNLLERQRPDHRSDAIVRIQQTLADFGGIQNRVAASKDRLLVAAAGIEDTGTQLALRAIAAWYGVYGYRTLVGLSEAFADSQHDVRGLMQQRIRQGVAAPGDLAQIDSYIASADTQLAEFRRAEAGAVAQYVAVMGAAPPVDLGRAPPPDLTGITEGALRDSVDHVPAVRSADAAAAAARHDSKALLSDLLPTISTGIDAGRYGVFETDRDYDIRGNVTLSWRIGGGSTQRHTQGLARAAAADARARRVRADTLRDAEIAWSDVAALDAARAAIEQNYLASRRARDVQAERFRVSRGTLFDVVAAESNFFSVATRYIQTVTELDTARYVLLARTGRLLPALGIDPADWTKR